MKDITKFILESYQQDLEDMTDELADWWDSHCIEDGYDSIRAFRQDMEAMADESNDQLVDDAFDYLEARDYDRKKIEKCRDDLVAVLVQWANDTLEEI